MSLGSYLDGLLKLILSVNFNGASVASTTVVNVATPLRAAVNVATQAVDITLDKLSLSSASALVTGILPGPSLAHLTDSGTISTAAFSALVGTMYTIAPQATFSINFPAITSAIAGQQIGICNAGTGATAVTLLPSGVQNIGLAAGTAATAAAPSSLKAQVYTANATVNSWVPGI